MKTYKVFSLVLLASAGLVGHVSANYTWQGGGTDDNWTTGPNWTVGTAPTSGQGLTFDGLNTTSNNNTSASSAFKINNLTFNADSAATTGFTLTGDKVSLQGNLDDDNQTLTETLDFSSTNSYASTNTMYVEYSGGTVLIENTWQGAYGVTKTGAGALIFSGSQNYTAATTISAGSLLLSGSGNINSSSGVTVSGGATFGTVTANTGTVAANTTAKTLLNTSTPLTLTLGATGAASSTLQFNLFGAGGTSSAPGSSTTGANDTISVGALALSGTGTVDISLNDQTTGGPSGVYELMDWTSGSATASDFTLEGSASTEGSLSVNSAGDELLFTASSVPEPGAWAMILGGLGILIAVQRRRRYAL